MNFKVWLEEQGQHLVYCDLDETLVWNKRLGSTRNQFVRSGPNQIGEPSLDNLRRMKAAIAEIPRDPEEFAAAWEQRGATIIKAQKDPGQDLSGWFVAKIRPHAHEFVAALRSFAEVFVITSGGGDFQTMVCQALGLPFSRQQIFGKGDYGQVHQSPQAVLLDDLGLNTIGVSEKLRAIGASEDRHIEVKIWRGEDNDTELLRVLPLVKKLLVNG